MNSTLSTGQLIGLIVPLAIVELVLLVVSLRDLIKRKKVKGGNKWPWVALIVIIGTIGPIIYLVAGREEE